MNQTIVSVSIMDHYAVKIKVVFLVRIKAVYIYLCNYSVTARINLKCHGYSAAIREYTMMISQDTKCLHDLSMPYLK